MTTIEYEMTQEDHLALILHSLEQGPAQRFMVGLRWIVILTLIGLALWVGFEVNAPGVVAPFGVVPAVLIWRFGPRYERWAMASTIRRKAKKDGLGHTGRMQLTLVEEGLRSESAISNGMTLWPAFDRIEETDTHAFIFVAPRIALVIPKRIGDDATAFLARFREQLARNTAREVAQPAAG